MKRVTFLLLSVFLMVPFQRRFHGFFDSFSRSLQQPEFPLPEFFSKKIHFFASDLLILVLVLFLIFFFKISLREFFWSGPSRYLILLFFVLLLSISTSITGSYSLQYFRLFEFSLIFLFFSSLCSLCGRIDLRRFIYRFAWLLVCVSLCECVIAIYQYFSQDSVGLSFLGERSPKRFPIANPGEHFWLLGEFFGSTPDSGCLYRVAATFGHPNILGGFLFCSVLASYYLCIQVAGKFKRLLLLVGIALQFFALYLSFSRSAMLALFLSTLLWCFLQLRNLFHKGGSLEFKRLATLAITVCSSALVCLVLLYPQLKARGGVVNYNTAAQEADGERVVYMKVAIEMIREHPFLGIGYNNFQIYASQLQKNYPHNFLFSKVHNIYLLIASESGLIGGGAFLLFLLALLRMGYRGLFSQPLTDTQADIFQARAFLFSTFVGFLLIGACDLYFLENPQGAIPFFGIAGLLCAFNRPLAYTELQ
jgi:hypothetical protein